MAAEDQVVRITYQELKEIVDARESDETGGNIRDGIKSATPSPLTRRQQRSRRPAQALYRPGQLRQGSESKTDDSRRSCEPDWSRVKEKSIDKQLDDLHIYSGEDESSQMNAERSGESKRRGKRPDIQIYKPRVKTSDRDRRSADKDIQSPSDVPPQTEDLHSNNEDDFIQPNQPLISNDFGNGGGSLPRRVQHVKSQDGGMRVTVMNDESQNVISLSSSGKEFGGRRNESSRGRGYDRGMRGRNFQAGEQVLWKEGFGRMGGNQENWNNAIKSYSKNRRSNSSESLRKEKDSSGKSGGRDDGYNFSSETFPRAKSGANKSKAKAMTASRERLNSGSGKGTVRERDSDKLYLGVTRQRTGSISSEASAASFNSNGSYYSGSSDWYTEEEEPEHIADWGEEVEKAHLEELARLVHHGAQELTSSLNTYQDGKGKIDSENKPVASMSASQTDPFVERPVQQKNIRNRSKRRHRRRKTSSQYSSRDSSVHSSIQGEEDNYSERGHRRRRRRHHSGRSQSGRLEDDGNPEGLQVTIGKNNRFVELNRDCGRGSANQPPQQQYGRRDHHHQSQRQDFYGRDGGGGRGAGGNNNIEGRVMDRQKWEKDVPPRFRRDSGGGGEPAPRRIPKGRGRGISARDLTMDEGTVGRRDRRSEDPSHDSTAQARVNQLPRGRLVFNNSRRASWDEGVEENKGPNVTKREKQPHSKFKDADEPKQPHTHNQGLIHLPLKSNVPSSHTNSSLPQSTPYPHHSHASTGAVTTTSVISSTHPHQQQHSAMSGDSKTTSSAATSSSSRGPIQGQKQLFDPNNPSKPILIPGSLPSPPAVPAFQDPEGLSPSPGGSTGLNLSLSPDSPKPPFNPPPPMYFPPRMYGFRPPMMAPYPQGPYPPMGPGVPFNQGAVPPHVFYRFPGMPPPDMASFYSGDLDGDSNGGSRVQCQMMAEQILRDSSPFDSQLGNILSRRPLSEDSDRMLNQIRFELRNRLEQVILMDIEVANKRNVEQGLWKSVYYQIIEAHRKRMTEQPEDKGSKDRLVDILNEGHRFFETLLKKLQTVHGFDLDIFTDGNRVVPEVVNRNIKLALLSAQRIMMFLGDIARYKEQMADTANYGKARNWYLKAQKLHPRNGRPYNQLAILAVYTKRKLDAVYYYMRSLAASNPIMTARESLMSLFDEVRRKVEIVEKKRLDERKQRLERHRKRKSMGARLEIWCSPDGVRTQGTVDEMEEEEDLSLLSAVELNKRFVLTYLNVHGKLFTKINFEDFAESSSLMLLEFQTLLQHSPCVMSSTRLLQLMGINMFSIENTALKDESLEASCRSVLQDHAVQVGLEMFGLLVKRTADLLASQMEREKKATSVGGQTEKDSAGGEKLFLDEDLHQMLPALKTWVDWMMCHAQLWNPQPFNRPPELGPDIDVWKNLAVLCDLLNNLDKGQISATREQLPDMEPVVLLEDAMLAGFIPMLSAPQEVFFIDKETDKRRAEDWLRMEKLCLFGEYLCGVEPPMLAFDVGSKKYHSVAPQLLSAEMSEDGSKTTQDSGDEYDDVEIEPNSDEDGAGSGDPNDSIQKLKLKKAQLNKKKVEQERSKESMEAILASHRHAKIELEIHPIFLIPDTNCFIDHFNTLRALLLSRKFTLVVPLVVINELDGLARGARDDQYANAEHAQMVKRHAATAIGFLDEEFDKKHPNLRAQTSKGSVMETIAFRSEESTQEGINDDVILSCCLHYCKDKAREFMNKNKDSAVRLYREVVLLTEDRNLRLKAHTCNVPVQDVPSFKKWSKIKG